MNIRTNEQEARIAVIDNGPGISEEHLEKIFRMFYRVPSKKVGSGIGLFIVREITQKMKGKVSVSSKLGSGTKFVIQIPNLLTKTLENGAEKDIAHR